nr:hypothetical protein CFP56_53603 [Quercus suber]
MTTSPLNSSPAWPARARLADVAPRAPSRPGPSHHPASLYPYPYRAWRICPITASAGHGNVPSRWSSYTVRADQTDQTVTLTPTCFAHIRQPNLEIRHSKRLSRCKDRGFTRNPHLLILVDHCLFCCDPKARAGSPTILASGPGARGQNGKIVVRTNCLTLTAVSSCHSAVIRSSSSINIPSPSRASRPNLLDDTLNSTLGVGLIPDSTSLAAALTGLQIEYVDGVTDVASKTLPPGWKEVGLSQAYLGSLRAHLNVARIFRIVEQNISSALIIEDDVDWDIRIKSQMRNFAKASRLLVQPLPGETRDRYLDPTYLPQGEKESREVNNFHVGIDSTSEPTTSPYGDLDRWDLLWLGHCGTIFPGNDDKDIPLARAVISDDETVPERQHIGMQFGDTDRFRNEYPDHTRVVSRARYSTCVLGYAVSQQGARRLLYELGLHKMSGPFDLALRHLCDGDGRDRMTCLAVQPELFNHHRPVGHKSGFSDISEHPDEYNSVAFSRNIRWATKVNMPKLVKGETDYIDLYKDGDEGTTLGY